MFDLPCLVVVFRSFDVMSIAISVSHVMYTAKHTGAKHLNVFWKSNKIDSRSEV